MNNGGKSDTSLVRALLSGNFQSNGTKPEEITDGIDIVDWSVRANVKGFKNEQTINFSIWDFAGQSVYYNTHQFFLSNRAVYFLLWNSRLGYEHAGLDFWLSSITCHAPKAPIFVIGTHADQVHRVDLPEAELKQTFPQIVNFSLISALIGKGVEELASELFAVTLAQKYMGERIPTIWLNLEQDIVSQRRTKNVVSTSSVEQKALQLGLLDMSEVAEALTFLHELGSLQYFSNEFLRKQVVINPQWLVDVMACLVTVKESVIKDGRFNRDDISVIWKKYDEELHPWLLQLTEEFDLTYALPNDNFNIVPCLLPEQEPEYTWPDLGDDVKEMKMTYQFQYLPAGLFNRTQTRLCQYADSSVVWKKGSMLHKNQHIALIRQSRDKELIVTVQGPRPENVLFLVHEVIEALVHQFFQGVSYDLFIPCCDCIEGGSQDPNMFSARQIKRANDMKAPFLQCSKNFHIVALGALQEFVPPASVTDFESHLSGLMYDLKELKANSGSLVLMISCPKDMKMKAEPGKTIAPQSIIDDLKKSKINVEMFDGLSRGKKSADVMTSLALQLNESALAVALISDSFCSDKATADLFTFLKKGSNKPIIPVVISMEDEWRKSGVGMLVTTEMYVDMRKTERYQQKLTELVSRINSKLTVGHKDSHASKQKFDVFFSYCWANSHDAVKKGSRSPEGALGQVDPRDIEAHLTKGSVKVWLDIRCAKEGVLFEEIAEALRGAKVMVACVSDQYLASRNCMLEYRFATGILKLPLILCVVGTGNKWHISEITMLALSAPRVDLQTKNANSLDQLLKYVTEILDRHKINDRPKTSSTKKRISQSSKTNNTSAYEELRELAQRKFLDEASILASNLKASNTSFSAPYPRLFFIDVKETVNIDHFTTKRNSRRGMSKVASSWNPSSMSRPISAQSSDEGEGSFSISFNRITFDNMCMKLLCEWDGQWHTVPSELAINSDGFMKRTNITTVDDLMVKVAPFLAKMYAILQHSPVPVRMLEGTMSETFLTELKRKALDDDTNTGTAYEILSHLAREADIEMHRGAMLRSSLHSRRILWLCKEHQSKCRATISNDTVDTDDVAVNFEPNAATPTLPQSTRDRKKSLFNEENEAKESHQESSATGDESDCDSENGDKTQNTTISGVDSRSPSSLARIRSKMCQIS